jgi:cytosine/adenosine deaminase-related metal-dependent hydrolase
VAHHNPYEARLFDRDFPVRVIRKFGWAHSLHFSPDLAERFRTTPPTWPFIVHAAEGRDAEAFSEIERLDAMGVLDRRTVLVHAIALKPSDIEILQARKCSIVWCPSSNLFAYGRTLTLHALAASVPIALGTDSALTADGDMVDEIRAARSIPQVSMERIFEMVTTRAASILRLPKASGEIQEHGPADLIAVADHGQSPADALANLLPDLVMIGGRIRLLSRRLSARNLQRRLLGMQRISVQRSGEWFVDVDIPLLHRATARVLGPAFRLAGKCVSV